MKIERHNRLSHDDLFVDETVFTTQNRYIGVRGCFEEDDTIRKNTMRGTYINGLYDTHKINYEEKAYGFAETAQSMVNLVDAQSIKIIVNNYPLSLNECELIELKRTYHLDQGYTERIVTYQTPDNHRFTLTFKRLTHIKFKELFMIDVAIHSHDYEGEIAVLSSLNGDVYNYKDPDDPRLATTHGKKLEISAIETEDNYGMMVTETKHTRFNIYTLMTHDKSFEYKQSHHQIVARKTMNIKKGETLSFRKYALYFNTLDHEQPREQALKLYEKLPKINVYETQIKAMQDFWTFANVEIEASDEPNLKDIVMYNIYQLYTSGGYSKRTNIPAKGLSGEGYEGHAFWDTEIYMIPFFMQVDPFISKLLLNNRYTQVPKAKEEARNLGVDQGIKFAWRTINGAETSAYFPAGQAQYHINSDVAYAFIKYYLLHQDKQYFITNGLPILIETARFFEKVLTKHHGKFHLHNVTGPDEYTAIVSDNYYTNAMLKYQLMFLCSFIQDNRDETYQILNAYKVDDLELNRFKAIGEHLYLPYSDEHEIDAQDANFLEKTRWDFNATPKENYPLLLHYHPLVIYRQQVLKQPDTVLAHYLLHDRPLEVMDRSFTYYENLTTHDSSLSKCIHAAQAARLGKMEKAYRYFIETVGMDLDNTQKNTEFGLHVANMGGMYIALVYGFIGLKITDKIEINPKLPLQMKHLNMNMRMLNDTIINVDLTQDKVVIKTNQPVTLIIYGKTHKIKQQLTLSTPN